MNRPFKFNIGDHVVYNSEGIDPVTINGTITNRYKQFWPHIDNDNWYRFDNDNQRGFNEIAITLVTKRQIEVNDE